MSDFQGVIAATELPENTSVAIEVDGTSVLVCHTAGVFVAVENRCSHQNQPLANGRIRNGYIFCPVHGMRFKLETGEAIGQLTSTPLQTFETRVVDGTVEVRKRPRT